MTQQTEGRGSYAPASTPVFTTVIRMDLEGRLTTIPSASIDMPVYTA